MKNEEVAKEVILKSGILISKGQSTAVSDCIKRCSDWLESGGNFTDDYIQHNQLGHLNRLIDLTSNTNKVDKL